MFKQMANHFDDIACQRDPAMYPAAGGRLVEFHVVDWCGHFVGCCERGWMIMAHP